MKALSIRQPWAYLTVQGIKPVENRSWYSKHRGSLLIHASKKIDMEGYKFCTEKMGVNLPQPSRLDYGAIIGIVRMIDCVQKHDSEWFFGLWGFVFEDPRFFDSVVPYKGGLRIFETPFDMTTRGMFGYVLWKRNEKGKREAQL